MSHLEYILKQNVYLQQPLCTCSGVSMQLILKHTFSCCFIMTICIIHEQSILPTCAFFTHSSSSNPSPPPDLNWLSSFKGLYTDVYMWYGCINCWLASTKFLHQPDQVEVDSFCFLKNDLYHGANWKIITVCLLGKFAIHLVKNSFHMWT